MMPLLTPILATLLLAQPSAARTRTGEVVDGQGKPVADAQVVLFAPPVFYGKGDPVEVQIRSDSQGKFSLVVPALERTLVNGVSVLAYRPGLAITAQEYHRPPYHLVLEKPRPRTVILEGPDGQPMAGARVALRLVRVFGKANAEVPASLADPLTTSTGPDGRATITYLAPRDQLVAVRVTADAIGTQDISLIRRPGRDAEESVITVRLKPTSHLAGRVVDQVGQPVAGQLVEVWSRVGIDANTVEFKNGPLRTRDDGSFQTPDNLMVGSTYRAAIGGPGQEPILSDWITMGEKPHTLPLMVWRPLRTVSGHVVDRQRKPVANIEVFQSGDGPERTTTRTDADGRFSLAGFHQGPVFLFARGQGFRFHGQLVKATSRDVTVELTRTSEPPTREMRMLSDPIPREESLTLARRLVEPLWDKVAQDGNDSRKFADLNSLAVVDPARVLQKLESVKFENQVRRNQLQRALVLALAPTDFEEASAVAESIEDPATRAWTLVHLADTLPVTERDRKLAMLDRALLQARLAAGQGDRLFQMGEVAERWCELGLVDKARPLFVEALQIARTFTDKTDYNRGKFAARLARVDLPAALAIARDFAGNRSQGRVYGGIAFRLIDENPAEAESAWTQTKGTGRLLFMDPTLCWKMATVDPARARRIIEAFAKTQRDASHYIFLALGCKVRDEAASRESFQTGVQALDRLMQDSPMAYQFLAGALLPIVERIDPALVPEVFWRDVASRLPVGNPRARRPNSPSRLVTRLAWYDRDIAAVLLEPSLARLNEAGNDTPWTDDFLAWSLFDPRAAVARLEKLPIDPKLRNNAIFARLAVAESLAQTHEQRWRKIWDDWDIILGGLKRDF